jgi:PAP2 superfamily
MRRKQSSQPRTDNAVHSDQTRAPLSGLDRWPTRREFLGKTGVAAAAALGASTLGVTNLTAEERTPLAASDEGLQNRGQGPDDAARRNRAYQIRTDAAKEERTLAIPSHPNNGDEALYPNRIGSYSKGLPHNDLGEVDPVAYDTLLAALASGMPQDFEKIPLGCENPSMQRRLVNPQAAYSYLLEGRDSHTIAMPAAPVFASAETAAEAAELYWMALCRDVPFDQYGSNPLTLAAAQDLSNFSDFRGPKESGRVTSNTLFRANLPGNDFNYYISQFLLMMVPYGAQPFEQNVRAHLPGDDHLNQYEDWLTVQNGCAASVPGQFDPVRRYVFTGRVLASFVQLDALAQAYFNACMISLTPPKPTGTFGMNAGFGGIGARFDPNNPYFGSNPSRTQEGLGTLGPPHALALMWDVSNHAVKAQWYQKWLVHRRLRPEAMGGRIHSVVNGKAQYPIDAEILNSPVLQRVFSQNGTYLLPSAFPEGSPTHPSYGAGHATVAGACVTILKALLDEDFVIPNPVVPGPDGTTLVPYVGPDLTLGNELNKLAANIGFGRSHGGIHWRSDNMESFLVGEALAISVLNDLRNTNNEDFAGYSLTKFDGTTVVVGRPDSMH